MKMKSLACLTALCLTIARSPAQSITLTTVTNPPQGGTISSAGVYPTGSTPTIQIQAQYGWYISDVDMLISNVTENSAGSQQFRVQLVHIALNNGDFTTITNDTETPTLNADNTFYATFVSLFPAFTQTPIGVATVTGGQVTFTAAASGRNPIQYQWQNGLQSIDGATNASLTLTNLVPTNSGTYSLVVSNVFGTTNASAQLVVRDLLILVNGELATNATTHIGQAFVTLQSRYTNGPIFYTLDGSTPDFSATPYSGGFFVPSSCIIRAIGYRSDFLASTLSDTVPLTIIPTYQLSIQNYGGGTVTVNPLSSLYTNGTVVTLIATPAAGWTFLGWSGELTGNSLSNSIVITHDTGVGGLFGTTIGTSSVGSGSITLIPNLPYYAAGMDVTVEAVPVTSNYFAAWGGALSGNTTPAVLYVGSTNQTVSALFAPLPSGKVTLTVLEDGGFVSPAIATNLYAVGGTNELFAYPYSGQQFLGWSGDASGTNNPLPVVMTQSKVITGHFSKTATLYATPYPNILDLSLYSFPGTVYRIDTSSNLVNWTPFLTFTNFFNPLDFSDSVISNIPTRFYRAVQQ
jgi:hypothetical protein